MKNITIVDKASGTATEHAVGTTSLKGTSIVKLPFGPESVQSFQQSGQNLVVTLKSGETVTIQNFFVVGSDGAANQLVLENADGTLVLGKYSSPYSGFTFSEVSALDDLTVATVAADSSVPSWVLWGLGLLAVGGVGAAINSSGGGGGGGGGGGVTPPAAASGLSVNAAGTVVSGRGQPGSTVTIKDTAGNILGSGKVGADGNFQVNLDSPRTNGEALEVTLTDPLGNTSPATPITAGDKTAPASPSGLAVSSDGSTVSGKGEPGSTVTIKDANGNVIGSGTVGADGNFQIGLTTPITNGQALQVTLTDKAGNESSAGTVTAGDTTAEPGTPPVTSPGAPTNIAVSADRTTVSGKGAAGSVVTIKDANGNVIGSGTVGADGNFQIVLGTPLAQGDTLQVTLKDSAGNESTGANVIVGGATDPGSPPIVVPSSPTGLSVSSDGTTVSGKGQPGTAVTIKDANGDLVGTGTVGADGNFQIVLSKPGLAGELLEVTLQDGAGNQSSPGVVIVGGVTLPGAPTDLSLSADGLTLSGKGQAGHAITIRNDKGDIVGAGTVAADGTFDITLSSAHINGQTLFVRLTNLAGNESLPGSVVAGGTPLPDAPTGLTVSADGTTVSGKGLPGSTITIKDGNGNPIGTGTVGADGNFQVVLGTPSTTGETLQVVLKDSAGNESLPGTVVVGGPVTLPDAPTGLTVSADGSTVSGKGAPGSTITIKDGTGNVIGSGTVGADGNFQVVLNTPSTTGETLQVVLKDSSGNESLPGTVVVGGPVTLPDAPTGLVVSADGSTVSGKGAPGSTIIIKDGNGDVIGSGTVAADGNFQVVLGTPSTTGETLQVILKDSAGNESLPGTVVVGGPVLPDAPTGLTVSADGTTVSGKGAPGSTITIKDGNGDVIGSGIVAADGNFQVVLNTPSTTGETLQVVLKDSAGNESLPGTVVVGGPVTLPDAPTGLTVSADGTTVSGKGAPGSTITIKDGNGDVIGSGTVAADGNFQVVLNTPSTTGETLQVVLKDSAGNESLPGTVVVGGPVTLPDAPTGLTVSADGTTVSGKGAPGSTITIKDGNGDVIGSGIVAADGNFQVVLNTPSTTGETLQVVLKDSAGNESLPGTVVVGGPVTLPDAPTGLTVSADGSTVSGKGAPGSTITIKDGNGDVIGSGTVAADGNFQVVLNTPSTTGETLQVVLKDSAGNESLPGTVVVGGPVTLPDAPTGLVVSADGTTVSGKGAPGSAVTIKDGNGDVIGSGTVAADGNFQVVLNTPSATGETLQVVLKDSAGNESLPGTVVVGGPVTLPDAPTGLVVSADGTTVSGKGTPGSAITIKDANGDVIGSGIVAADGNFQVVLNTPSTTGETLQVVLKDSAGNESLPGTVVVGGPVTLPDAPTGLTVSADGSTVSGKGAPGSTITIKDGNGDVIGSGTVAADGNFQVVLNTPSTTGETLQVVLKDSAGNESLPGTVVVGGPVTLPDAPTGLVVSADGTTVSGKGAPGSAITIKDGTGNVIGSGTVAADGSFQVVLNTPSTTGETLQVVLKDSAGNESLPGTVVVGGPVLPDAPTGLVVSADGTTVSGKGAPGSAITIKDGNGDVIGSGTVAADGNFQVVLGTPSTTGETLQVVLKDSAGNESLPGTVVVGGPVTLPDAPTGLVVSADGTTVSGKGAPGSAITIKDANGDVIGSGTVAADGNFQVVLNTPSATGATLQVVLKDSAGNESLPGTVVVGGPVTLPDTPTGLTVNADGTTISGKGLPGAAVTVRDVNGDIVGVGTVGNDGNFQIVLIKPGLDGEVLEVTLQDGAGNQSLPGAVIVGGSTVPGAPTDLSLSADGLTLSGKGQAGHTITIKNDKGDVVGSGTVAADGTFDIPLTSAHIKGETLLVRLTDLAGNESLPGSVVAGGTPGLNAPTDVTVSADGITVSGKGEPGASVTVKDATGTVIGTGTVGVGGTFEVTLDKAQVNGETLAVALKDGAGNESGPTTVTAPDVDGNGTDPDLEAFDDLATAQVNIKPVASNTQLPNVHVYTLAAVGEVIVIGDPIRSQTFSVAEGMSGTLNLGFVQGNLLSLLGGGLTATLEVSDGKGGWLPVQQGSTGGGLLDLLGLFGSNSSAKVEGLAAGQYRFTLKLDPNLLTLGAAATAVLSVTNNSLTDFEGVAGPEISGNVITDPGFDGKPDSQGSGGVATIQVEVNGQLVDAAAVGTPGTVLQGQYGQLTIFANGNYKYTPNGDIASIGKVDAFEYHLVTAAGGSASATLYVRIDSPNTNVTWSTTDPSAPGVIDTVANDDVGSVQVDINNVVGPATVLDPLTYVLPAAASGVGATIVVAADTKADLAIDVSATGLAVIPNTTVTLEKLLDGVWVKQQSVTQTSHVFTGLEAGSYRVTASTTSLLSLATIKVAQTLTPTYLTQFVVGQMTSAKGNVLGDDVLGSPLTALSVSVSPGNFVTPGQTGAVVKGDYGTLTLFANGSYTYKPDAALKLADIGKVDSFTYKLTHPTGKEDTATLYIRIDTPDRDLIWDDANPGAPATEGAAFAANEVAALAAASDESGDAQDDSESDDGESVALADTEFSLVDGVAGLDTLHWAGGDAAINLTDLIGKVSGIQSIDLNSFSSVDLTLSLEDLVSVTGPDADRLFIQGDGQDSVHLTGDWASVATQVSNGLEYVIYTAQEDETHQLWVQSGVSVV